uniref:Brix domain-containing protein n=1 Tax=Ditylenchus dipsaci TaxID=166011 RepID=A0A915D8G4_9BILA
MQKQLKMSQKKVPKTIENTREPDDTYMQEGDQEVLKDEGYFKRQDTPKVLITTSPGAKVKTWKLCFELRKCIPNVEIFSRKNVALKKIAKQAIEREYTDVLVVHEDQKRPNGILLCHLPSECLFPKQPHYLGRRVVTFHNQRDYIFFRHHRYEFKKNGEKAALLELGPRMTLRLKRIQDGAFTGEYIWVLKRHEMETSRRKFML